MLLALAVPLYRVLAPPGGGCGLSIRAGGAQKTSRIPVLFCGRQRSEINIPNMTNL